MTTEPIGKEIVAEKNLAETFINSLPGIFYMYDDTGKFMRWNKNFEAISGYSAAEIAQMHPLDFFDDDEKELLTQKIKTVFETGDGQVQAHFLTKSGQKIDYYFNGRAEHIDGKTYLMGMGIDITLLRKTQYKLKFREQELRLIYDSVSDPIFLLRVEENNRYKFISINNSFLSTTGLGRKQVLNQYVNNILPPSALNLVLDKYRDAILNKKIVQWEEVSEYPTGVKTGIISVAPVFDEAGNCAFLAGLVHDITERKKAEEAIAKSEKQFRQTMDKMLEGIQIFDKNWRCQYVNEAVAQQGPYSVEQTLGRTLMENFPGIEHTELFRIFKHCRDHGESKHIEYQFTFPDNSTRWFELSIQPNPEGLFVLSVDIDERKKAEEALKASEEKYRYLFDNNPAIIFIWSLENLRLLECNETALKEFGYTKEEVLEMTLLDFRPPEDHERVKAFAQKVRYENAPLIRGTWKHYNRNRELVYMDIVSHHITYNNYPAILSVAENVTLKLKMEEQLQKSYNDIRQLNAHLETIREDERSGIAREIHDELGQQLTGLKIDTSWLLKKLLASDPVIREKVGDMLSLIDDTVKTVRRISSDLRPGILDDLGLVAALEWQCGEFEKRSGIDAKFTTQLSELDIDRNLAISIFRVYQETLTNVMRHAQATHVKAGLQQLDGQLILTVNDNGKGFDVADNRGKKTFGLIGMKERANMLGGQLSIESEKNKGTTVTLKVPLSSIQQS